MLICCLGGEIGRVWERTKSQWFVRRGVRERRSRGRPVGESCSPPFLENHHVGIGTDHEVRRLLEVFGVLKQVNTIKDVESVHYESLVSEYERLVRIICEDHTSAADAHIQDERIRRALRAEIEAECNEIIEYRLAAERWKLEIDSRSKDRLVSFGEKLSCRFMAALLQDRVSAICERFGIVID